jgi:hypothetical protein
MAATTDIDEGLSLLRDCIMNRAAADDDDKRETISRAAGTAALHLADAGRLTEACEVIELVFDQNWTTFEVQMDHIGGFHFWTEFLRKSSPARGLRRFRAPFWRKIEESSEPVTSWGNFEAMSFGLACAR